MIFATNSAKHFCLDNGNLEITRFPDGEININLNENVKNKEVFVIGSTEPPAENLLELILLIGAILQKGAQGITVVIPYFGYARSDNGTDKVNAGNVKTVVEMLENVGDKKCNFIILDPHNEKLESYFSSPFNKIDIIYQLCKPLQEIEKLTVVAPDRGSKENATQFAQKINSKNIVTVEKTRLQNAKVKLISVSGNVTNNAVIIDDMVSSGNTVLETAKMLKSKGAEQIYIAVTHMLYSADGWKKLTESPLIKKVFTTDTIAPPKDLPSKFEIIPITPILKKIIL
jgi:ribose-phosphate pyrophosphokinase